MMGYLARLARQNGLIPGPLAAPSGSAQVGRDGVAKDLMELHETHDSPGGTRYGQVDAPSSALSATGSLPAVPDRLAHRPSEETIGALAQRDVRSAPIAMRAAERQPAEEGLELSARSVRPDPTRATALEAVQRVVEWIAAGPQPSEPERHGVKGEIPTRLAASEPSRATMPRAAARAVPSHSASDVNWLPDAAFNGERRKSLAIDERATVEPSGGSVEPARPAPHDESSGEALSVSIGSIHVTVEAPPAVRAPVPQPVASAPGPEAPRLARHYVRAS